MKYVDDELDMAAELLVDAGPKSSIDPPTSSNRRRKWQILKDISGHGHNEWNDPKRVESRSV